MRIIAFATDKEKELEGVWFPLGDGLEILVARMNNTNYTSRVRKQMQPYQSTFQRKALKEDAAEAIQNKAMAGTIVLDWKDMQDEDGAEGPFSEEICVKYLQLYPEFKKAILEFAGNMDNYVLEAVKEIGENVKKS